ncbi:CRISPR-associated protein Cas4 [Neisseria elongata]|mgnify:CR=1 FL=1|uniref:CRISPR-associated exonuclease Cas4 n=1 Tax=Neisseria elongata subsp. glycolytica ATCC 29315 TaxID=546263 RepID=D4DQE6_NEIEG|nr:CRISPR-associated protein Cas4 [Neisseria elongata]EFE50029.1 CRISPR-associated protein Cas4 [Neisseria elongata subsp. glycolytica ATCC 29315]SQH50688.1 recombinase B [Neisseria elongata subsp. glycolytica]
MTALLTESQGENQDTRLIPLSALQHYAFCPRQCALIHNEQAWAENYLTAQGRALHERVDSGEPETRKGVRFERTVHVSAEKLGISGVLDLVEVDTKTGRLKPVEYKRGKPKPDPMDEIQLCAQGLCLEEMTGQTVSEGALWYMQTRHRVPVVFSDDLRTQTLARHYRRRPRTSKQRPNPAAQLRQTLQILLAGGDLPAGVVRDTG